jgi:predicted nucleic acid-binding protein
MSPIFIDAGPLYALNSLHDQYYHGSQVLLNSIKKQRLEMVTTDYVIDEALTLLITSRKGGYHFSLNLLKHLFGKSQDNSTIKTEWISQDRFRLAAEIFRRYNRNKTWSFTDCTSFVVMKELKIKTAFTFDDHFDQMGFKILG